jgi:hypothetical protein
MNDTPKPSNFKPLKPKAYMDAIVNHRVIHGCGEHDKGGCATLNELRAAYDQAMNEMRKPDEQLPMILTDEQQFIARMVREYKAQLVNYVSRSQNYIDEYADHNPNSGGVTYWRAELIEATRRLELSDSELLPLISAAAPYHLVRD